MLALVHFPSEVAALPLERLPDAFDHPDWLFEPKYDGFRGLLHLTPTGAAFTSKRASHSSASTSWPARCGTSSGCGTPS